MPVPNRSFVVDLDVSNQNNNGKPGWINVKGSDNHDFWYKYSGGNHTEKNGHVTHTIGHGDATVTVNLYTDYYEIDEVYFTGDSHGQLSANGAGKYTRTITNTCTAAMEVSYKVRVRGSGTTIRKEVLIVCDPMIRNVPA